jgi:hypothetical protein
MKIKLNELRSLVRTIISEEKSKSGYEVYHNSYSSAIDEALDYAKSKGYEPDADDVWNEISMGKKKPKEGDTNRFSIKLFKDGKEQKKALQIQVYGMKNKYELNAYIN